MPLKLLLIDTDPDRARALEEHLSGFAEIVRAPSGADLAAFGGARSIPTSSSSTWRSPTATRLEDIRLVSAAHPIVMFAASDDPAFAEEAIAAGVCSYNLSGIALSDVKPIMASAIALFRRYRRVENELAAARALLEERRLMERAKAILMQGRKMTEPEAYRWLQKKAMNENRKLAQVVAEFIRQHGPGPDAGTKGERKRR